MFEKIGNFMANVDWEKVGKIACYVGSAALTVAAKCIGDHQRTEQFEGIANKFCENHFADLNFNKGEGL